MLEHQLCGLERHFMSYSNSFLSWNSSSIGQSSNCMSWTSSSMGWSSSIMCCNSSSLGQRRQPRREETAQIVFWPSESFTDAPSRFKPLLEATRNEKIRFRQIESLKGKWPDPPLSPPGTYPGTPLGPPPGSLLGGQQGGFAPSTTRRESDAKTKRKCSRMRCEIDIPNAMVYNIFAYFVVQCRPHPL